MSKRCVDRKRFVSQTVGILPWALHREALKRSIWSCPILSRWASQVLLAERCLRRFNTQFYSPGLSMSHNPPLLNAFCIIQDDDADEENVIGSKWQITTSPASLRWRHQSMMWTAASQAFAQAPVCSPNKELLSYHPRVQTLASP